MVSLEKQANAVSHEVDEESAKWINYIGQRETLRNREVHYNENLRKLVDSEHLNRKFYQSKSLMLTDIFKNMEHLLISIDKAVV